MEHSAAIGAGRNPRFGGGVAIVFPDFSVSSLWNPNSRRQITENKSVQGMWGWNTPTLFSGTPPLLSLFQKACGSKFHEKHPKFARQIGSANRVARYVE